MKVKAFLVALVFVLVVPSIFADSTDIIKLKLDELAELQDYRTYEKRDEGVFVEKVETKLDDLNEKDSRETLIGLTPYGDFTRVVYRRHFIDAETAALFGSIITKLTREDDGYWVRPTSNGKFQLIFDSFLNYRFALDQQQNIRTVLSN